MPPFHAAGSTLPLVPGHRFPHGEGHPGEGAALGPFVLNHEPGPTRTGYALAGHIHPAVRLSGEGGETLRLPCFWFAKRHGVLPAFGAFTGSAVVRPRPGDRVFVIAEEEVLRVA